MKTNIFTFILLLVLMGTGLTLAQNRPLENDEVYSQKTGVQGLSFLGIFQGKVGEGNNSPLFYTAQKIFCGLSGFRLDEHWQSREEICGPNAQMMLRVLPCLYMSLALCLIFYFFARNDNLWIGTLALLLALTSPMIWLYWAWARPYGLWVLLTTAQILLYLDISKQPGPSPRALRALGIVHVLLSITALFGMVQAVIAAVLIRKRVFWLVALPLMLGLFYALRAPRFPFFIAHPAAYLIYDNFAVERLVFIGICAAWMAKRLAGLFKYLIIFLAIPLLVIGYYTIKNAPGTHAFLISPGYFIFLTPLSVIAVMLLWKNMWDNTSNPWMRFNLIQAMAGILLLGGIRTYIAVQRFLI